MFRSEGLGPLGFLALEAFKNENAAGSVGSYGIYDQIAMLKWVQTNIGAFGGDKTKVTIAGESAGAFSSCIHLTSPLSKGLFRAAILESGTCSSTIFFQAQKDNLAWGATFANITGCNPAFMSDDQVRKCIRGLDLNGIMGPELNYSYSGYFPLMYPTVSSVLLDHICRSLVCDRAVRRRILSESFTRCTRDPALIRLLFATLFVCLCVHFRCLGAQPSMACSCRTFLST